VEPPNPYHRIERIVFFGTPAFAVPALEALVAAGRTPILVVSQPARPAGRGKKLTDPPLAVRARELGIAVAQPFKVREPEFLESLRRLAPDLAVVVAFGQIFPAGLLALPRFGCINVHASLLPRWRGAAPIAAAIAAGDRETGVAIQRMEAGLDAGPVFAARRTPIGRKESAGELAGRLSKLGADLLVEVVAAMEAGLLTPAPQSEEGVTYAPKLEGPRELDLSRGAEALAREVRAFNPEPGTALDARRERLKVMLVSVAPESTREAPGSVIGVLGDALRVAAGDGSVLELVRVQRPGGKPVSGRDLANGLRLAPGEKLG
jgi:methionyl-tRNA formyltransferase